MHRYWRAVACVAFVSVALILAPGPQSALAQGERTPPAHILEHLLRTGNVPLLVQLKIAHTAVPHGAHPLDDRYMAAIAHAQQGLLERLSPYAPQNVKQYRYVPLLALTLESAAALDALYADPEVAGVQEDLAGAGMLQSALPVIGADFTQILFYLGTGQTIAILDSGIDKTHPDLRDKVVAEACYSTTNAGQNSTSVCPGGADSSTAVNSGVPCAPTIFGCDHGTQVAGVAAGVAPGATLISIKTASSFADTPSNTPCSNMGMTSPCVRTYTSDQIRGMEQIIALSSIYRIAAVNISVAGGQNTANCDFDARKVPIDILRSFGILTVAGAGNGGNSDAMGAPACISSAISVAASNDADQVAPFTDVSPSTTLYAPGADITTLLPGGGTAAASGSSLSTPLVAGAIAVLRQVEPNITPAQVIGALTNFGPLVTDQRIVNGVTKRRLAIYDALCSLVVCDDDDFATLPPTGTHIATIAPGADRDHFFYDGSAGNILTVAMNRTGSSNTMDPYLELYDPTGVKVALNNDGGPGVNALINGYSLAQTGRYLVVARSVNRIGGSYEVTTAREALQVNPVPRISLLSPGAVSGSLTASDFWLRIQGSNFQSTTEVRWNGSLRAILFDSSSQIQMRVRGSDLGLPWPRNALIAVTNPEPGGGTVSHLFEIRLPTLGASELVQPASLTSIPTGISTTLVLSWTAPVTATTWRSMQNMDLRLRDANNRIAAWIRVTEQVTQTSTMRLLNGAVVVGDAEPVTPTVGIPGVDDLELVMGDIVTLHLKQSAFSGAGLTAVMSPTVTFGPLAVGTYNVEFRVDGPNGEVQDDDVLGVIHIVSASCPAAVVELDATGPTTTSTGVDVAYSATLSPVGATGPVTITWAPEPTAGQGTLNATYRFATAGTQNIFVSAENCGGFGADIVQTAVARSSGVDLEIAKSGPASALAGEPISYTLTITNHGAMPATDLSVVDTLPADATYVTGGAPVGNAVSFVVPTLDGYGATTSLAFSVKASTTITNAVYGVNADGGASATGTVGVVTTIPDAQVAVGPTLTGTLIFDGDAAALQAQAVHVLASVSITFPAGTVFDETTLTFVADTSPGVNPPTGKSAVATFALGGNQGGQTLPTGQVLGEVVPIQMSYSDAAVNGLEESSLQLYVLDGGAWSSSDIACSVNAAANRLDCTLGAPLLSDYLVAAEAADPEPEDIHLFIPAIRR